MQVALKSRVFVLTNACSPVHACKAWKECSALPVTFLASCHPKCLRHTMQDILFGASPGVRFMNRINAIKWNERYDFTSGVYELLPSDTPKDGFYAQVMHVSGAPTCASANACGQHARFSWGELGGGRGGRGADCNCPLKCILFVEGVHVVSFICFSFHVTSRLLGSLVFSLFKHGAASTVTPRWGKEHRAGGARLFFTPDHEPTPSHKTNESSKPIQFLRDSAPVHKHRAYCTGNHMEELWRLDDGSLTLLLSSKPQVLLSCSDLHAFCSRR